MNRNNENSHTTKTSHQLHKNYVFQRGSETIQHIAPVPARGYVTYSSSEVIDHRGDGQWQTQRRYGSSAEEIVPRDHRASSNYYANSGNFQPNKASQPRSYPFHSQRMPKSSNDYQSDDPVFDEFLHVLMESFEGYDNPNIIGYRTEFSTPIGHYNDPNFTNTRNTGQVHDTFSRPDSPSTRGATSLGPENGTWRPGPRVSPGKYPEWLPGHSGARASPGKYSEHQYDQPRFGPHTPSKQTQFNYPDSSVRIYEVHPRTEWLAEPGRQRSELSPQQNFGYKNHQYAPDPTDQTQFPNTQPQRNSPRPLLTTRFEAGKLPNGGGYGYSPSGDVDYTRNSPKEGYNYSYAPPAPSAPRDTITRPEMATNWEAKVNKQPNTGDKISDMATGALNFAKKNLNHVPNLPENGNTRPDMRSLWQFTNQPKFGVKSSDNGSLDSAEPRQYTVPEMQENGNTRPEFSMVSSQGKGNGFPEKAKSWFSKQINTGEKNPHNETLDSPKPIQSSTPSSQGNGYTRPEFSRSASQGNGNTLPEFSRSASQGNGNTLPELSNSASQGNGNTRPEFSRSASQGNGNTRPEFSRSASQGKGNAFPAKAKSWFSKQPNRGEKNSHNETLDFPNPSQFPTTAPQENGNSRPEFSRSASQGKGNADPEMENHWERTNQPNKGETYSNTGDLNSPIEYARPGKPNHRDISNETNTGGNDHPEMVYHPDVSNQPYTGEENSMGGAMGSSRRSQVPLDSKQTENGIPNGSQISKQPNIREKFSKLGAMSSAKKSSFPTLFSK